MASDAEIREAEQAVIDAVLIDAEVIDEENHRALRRAALALKALKSPLPSRAEMARRSLAVARCATIETPAEQHWADALRWVQGEMNRRYTASETDHIHPDELADWADELEARE